MSFLIQVNIPPLYWSPVAETVNIEMPQSLLESSPQQKCDGSGKQGAKRVWEEKLGVCRERASMCSLTDPPAQKHFFLLIPASWMASCPSPLDQFIAEEAEGRVHWCFMQGRGAQRAVRHSAGEWGHVMGDYNAEPLGPRRLSSGDWYVILAWMLRITQQTVGLVLVLGGIGMTF